jgi:hypothetical protein
MLMVVITKKQADGKYHFGYFERHYFKPKKHNHFNGKVYVLTGGNSFSATTLFTSSVIKQDNIIVVGEETGGGAWGTSEQVRRGARWCEMRMAARRATTVVVRTTRPRSVPKQTPHIAPTRMGRRAPGCWLCRPARE